MTLDTMTRVLDEETGMLVDNPVTLHIGDVVFATPDLRTGGTMVHLRGIGKLWVSADHRAVGALMNEYYNQPWRYVHPN